MTTNNPHIKKMDQGVNPADSQPYPDQTDDVGGDYGDWDQGSEISDADYGEMNPYATEGDVGGSSSYVQLNAKQQEVANWLDTQDDVINAKYQKAQQGFSDISEGDMSPEKKQEMLKTVEKTLRELEVELSVFDAQADVFEKMTGLNSSDVTDKTIGEDFNNQITKLKSSITSEKTKIDGAITKQQESDAKKAADEKAKTDKVAAEKAQKEGAANTIREAATHLEGGGGTPYYYTYQKADSSYAKDVLNSIASAIEDGDWDSVEASISSITEKRSDDALSLVAAVLKRYVPSSVLEKISSKTLDSLASRIKLGNHPKYKRVKFSDNPRAQKKTGTTGVEYASMLHEMALASKKVENEAKEKKAETEGEDYDLGSFGPDDSADTGESSEA